MVRAALAGLAIAVASAPLGCFVVWRRMAYFGDATAHAAVLGVALALSFNTSIMLGVFVVSLAMAVFVTSVGRSTYEADTMLGVSAHAALAAGIVAVSLSDNSGIDLEIFLFGEILAVSYSEVAVFWAVAAAVSLMIYTRWTALIASTMNEEMAHASGFRPRIEQLLLNLSLAALVAAALKVVGALLVTAMLIIPAAAARAVCRTPEQMAVAATVLGSASVLAGLAGSYRFDTPAGPTMVVCATALFALSAASSFIMSRIRGQS